VYPGAGAAREPRCSWRDATSAASCGERAILAATTAAAPRLSAAEIGAPPPPGFWSVGVGDELKNNYFAKM